MRRKARVDKNQKQIVDALRRCGASVFPTHTVGGGFPDIVVGFQGVNYLVEIKDGEKIPSKRKLTPDEVDFHDTWRGRVWVVESVDDALKMIGSEKG